MQKFRRFFRLLWCPGGCESRPYLPDRRAGRVRSSAVGTFRSARPVLGKHGGPTQPPRFQNKRKIRRNLALSSVYLRRALGVHHSVLQGVPLPFFTFWELPAPKLSTLDHGLVKPKCVWSLYISYGKIKFTENVKKLRKLLQKYTNFGLLEWGLNLLPHDYQSSVLPLDHGTKLKFRANYGWFIRQIWKNSLLTNEMYNLQTHFGFTNPWSKGLSFWARSSQKVKNGSGTPCIINKN